MEWLLFCVCIFGIEFQLIILIKMLGDIQQEELEVENEYKK